MNADKKHASRGLRGARRATAMPVDESLQGARFGPTSVFLDDGLVMRTMDFFEREDHDEKENRNPRHWHGRFWCQPSPERGAGRSGPV